MSKTNKKKTSHCEHSSFLAQAASDLLESDDMIAATSRICSDAMAIIDCQIYLLFILDERRALLRRTAYAGVDAEGAEKISTLLLGQGVCGKVACDGVRVVLENIQNSDDDRTNMLKSFGVQSGVCHPLKAGGKTFGTLLFGSRTIKKLAEAAVGFCASLSGLIAMAIRRQRSEAALRQSENQYQTLVEAIPDIIMRFDRSRRYLFATNNVKKYFTLSAHEIIGKTHRDLDFTKEQCFFWEQALDRVFTSGQPFETEFSLTDKAGGQRLLNFRLVPEKDATGETQAVIAIARDITAHRRLERNYQELFQQMMDAFAVHEVIWDENGKPVDYLILAVNPAYERHTGFKAENVVGKRVLEVAPNIEPCWLETCGRVALTGEPAHMENKVEALGKIYEASIYRNAPGQLTCVFRDITNRRRLEERMRQAAKMEAIGQVASGVAHDFNNQLAGILGYAELLVEQIADENLRQYAAHICTAARRAADLTKKILAFARNDKTAACAVDIHQIIAETAAILAHSVDKRIEIRQNLAAASSVVLGDPTQLQNALLNLATNARDAMPGGGVLLFKTDEVEIASDPADPDLKPGRYLRICVSDTGVGMDRETLKRVFEPFFTTKKTGRGTGLGMVSVLEAVNSHHGKIEISSEPGKGTTVEVLLPLLANGEKKIAAVAAENTSKRPASSGQRILVVDDDETCRDLTCDMLRGLGYKAVTCACGEEAIGYYLQSWQEIDLVILDMLLPRWNGRDIFVALRKINPDIKAIMASGCLGNADINTMRDEGVLDFLAKPFTVAEMADKVAKALERR